MSLPTISKIAGLLLISLLAAEVPANNSIYSVESRRLYTSYLEFMGNVYDVEFLYAPETNRVMIDSFSQRTDNLSPDYGERIQVSDNLNFHLPRIHLNGQLFQADFLYRPAGNNFSVENLAAANEQSVTRGEIISSELVMSMSKENIALMFFLFSLEAAFPVNLTAGNDIEIYKVVYRTIDPAGETTQASALIALPKGESSIRPMMAYQHFTIVERSEAPTEVDVDFFTVALASAGYVTVTADYLGFGVSDFLHPYVNGHSLATSLVDAIRAGRSLSSNKNISLNKQLFLMGYSEGGYATMALQKEIQNNHANEFAVTASAPMAGPYDLSDTMVDRFFGPEPHPNPSYFPFTLLAANQVYGLVDSLDAFFKPPFDSNITGYFDGTLSAEQINGMLPSDRSQLYTDEFFNLLEDTDSRLNAASMENDIYRWNPEDPTRLYHCVSDDQVPFENSETAYNYFLSAGAENVELIPVPDNILNLTGSHVICAVPLGLMAMDWFDSFLP